MFIFNCALFKIISLSILLNFDFVWSRSIAKCSPSDNRTYTIETSEGKVTGNCEFIEIDSITDYRDSNVYSWLSIPYAEPPTGPLRFKLPVSIKQWKNIVDGTKTPRSCVPFITSSSNSNNTNQRLSLNENFSEDCLYLSIWAPADAYLTLNYKGNHTKKFPILVLFNQNIKPSIIK